MKLNPILNTNNLIRPIHSIQSASPSPSPAPSPSPTPAPNPHPRKDSADDRNNQSAKKYGNR